VLLEQSHPAVPVSLVSWRGTAGRGAPPGARPSGPCVRTVGPDLSADLPRPACPVFSSPVPSSPGRHVADLGDFEVIEFIIDDETGLVSVYNLVWTSLKCP
jgi:hypothetical protein